ncbi:MAG: N-acetylmuramic acid 6-phosphate etherase, partial [Oscillospiraceae bacterium]|nr:N-acetylmuramic acid 6-phosphate etherase [Oscillospiraceae bacterium]MCL2279988.1 N-acetylmuramic acid 6-phosphate etherase [Oscillospiraceae bacterium]
DLDTFSAFEIVTAMNNEDAKLAQAVKPALEAIAKVADCVADAFSKGGRLFYIGAGTSGRLGVLDASECPPTFGVPPTQVVGIIAGGDTALRNPVEGAEDNRALCRENLIAHNLSSNDVVVGIAASGTTPYVIGGLEYAKEIGCMTASVSCNSGSSVAKTADIAIEVIPGPEVLTGSTRLKSGTVQKMVLNMITTTSMVRSGKAYQNLMVDVVQSNKKLNTRAENIVIEATEATREVARKKIDEAQGKVKTAIVMILLDCDKTQAESMLKLSKGHVREAVAQSNL